MSSLQTFRPPPPPSSPLFVCSGKIAALAALLTLRPSNNYSHLSFPPSQSSEPGQNCRYHPDQTRPKQPDTIDCQGRLRETWPRGSAAPTPTGPRSSRPPVALGPQSLHHSTPRGCRCRLARLNLTYPLELSKGAPRSFPGTISPPLQPRFQHFGFDSV